MENGHEQMQEVEDRSEFPPLPQDLNNQVMHSCLTCFNSNKFYCDCLNLCLMASELINKSGSAPIYSFVITNHAHKRPNFGRDRESNSCDKVNSPNRTLRYPNEFLNFSLDDIDNFMENFSDYGIIKGNLVFWNKNYISREPRKIIASCYANIKVSSTQRGRSNMSTIREENRGVDGASNSDEGDEVGDLNDTEIVNTGTQNIQRFSSTPLNPTFQLNRGGRKNRDLGDHIANLTAAIRVMNSRMNDMARDIGSQANYTTQMKNELNDRINCIANVSSQNLNANGNGVQVSCNAVAGPSTIGNGMPETQSTNDSQVGMAALARAIAMVQAASVNNAGTNNLINNNPIMSTGLNSVASNANNINNSYTQGGSGQVGQNVNLNLAPNNNVASQMLGGYMFSIPTSSNVGNFMNQGGQLNNGSNLAINNNNVNNNSDYANMLLGGGSLQSAPQSHAVATSGAGNFSNIFQNTANNQQNLAGLQQNLANFSNMGQYNVNAQGAHPNFANNLLSASSTQQGVPNVVASKGNNN